MPSVSAVVPVFNSEQSIPELTRRLIQVLSACAGRYEIILVNDGSRDRSWAAICAAAAAYPCVRGIDLMRNYGQHNALLAGIRAAQYEIVVTLDDDLQNPPEEAPKLIARLEEGYDVVYGVPEHEQHGVWRDLASQITKLALQSTMGAATARKVSAFRAFRTELRRSFASYQSSFASLDVLLTWGTTRFSGIPVRHAPRRVGASNYTFRKLVTHAVNMMTGFSTLPLELASLVGFAFTLVGMLTFVYVIVRYFVDGDVVPGFPFLASLIAILSGAQLFALGIIGEYIARIHFRTMERPLYVVRSQLAAQEPSPLTGGDGSDRGAGLSSGAPRPADPLLVTQTDP